MSEARALEWDLYDRLHKAMRVRGISTSELADELGVHRNTINNYLGGRSPIDRRTLVAWAFACGVPVRWLESGEPGPDTAPASRNARTRHLHPAA